MEMLHAQGRAGDPWKFRFKNKRWQCETPPAFAGKSIEEAILESVRTSPFGWYFYGASISGAYHSLVIGVDHRVSERKVYWLDQFSNGLTRRRNAYATASVEVSGRLDQAVAKVGTNPTRLWPLYMVLGLRDIARGLEDA